MVKLNKKMIFLTLIAIALFIGSVKNVFLDNRSIPSNVEINNENIILIDPGHGGFDGGAVSRRGVVEKHINLSISLKLRDKLKSLGYQVLMTREDDRSLHTKDGKIGNMKLEDLNNRCKMKKGISNIVFISIHQNFYKDINCSGPQVWYSDSFESLKLAYIIQCNLNKDLNYTLRKEKEAKGAYKILRCYPSIPSIIIECGFLTNPEEEIKLQMDAYQYKIADSITKSINQYYESGEGI